MKNIRLIFGLGNPGKKYQKTRHNLGFRVIECLAHKQQSKLARTGGSEDKAELAIVHRDNSKNLIMAKPLTYVNLSGPPLKKLMHRYRLGPEEILIVSDDFSLPLGTIRIRSRGSSGGHKGLESIIATLGTKNFPRLRIGCGPLPQGISSVDYVLGQFTKEEESDLGRLLPQIAEAIDKIITFGLEKAMSLYNRRRPLTLTEPADSAGRILTKEKEISKLSAHA